MTQPDERRRWSEELPADVIDEIIDAAAKVANGIDGTFNTTVEQRAATLEAQQWGEPVPGEALAALLRAAGRAGIINWA